MTFSITGFSGDHAGSGLIGREPFRALISLTHADGDFPAALFQTGDLDGTTWYYNIHATCLTRGALPAIVTKVEDVGDYVWSIEVTPHEFGGSADHPWEPGIHLFSLMMLTPGGNQSGAIASVIVGSKRRAPLKLSAAALTTLVNRERLQRAAR